MAINKLAVYPDLKKKGENSKSPNFKLLCYKVNCSTAAKSSALAELMLFISFACVSINGGKLL